MEKNIKLSECFLRFHYWPFLMFGLLATLVMPLLAGMENLDASQSGYVVEHFFTIVGIVVFFPLYLPDIDQDALDMIRTKKTAYIHLILTRLVLILATASTTLILFLLVLKWNHSSIQFSSFFLAEMATLIFLGGLSAVAFALAKHPIPALMLPMLYYIICMFSSTKYMKVFYLFTLPDKDWGSKVALFIVGAVLFTGSMLVALRSRHKD